MEVNKINSVSQVGFEGFRSKKSENKADSNSYQQMEAPASRSSSKAMKALLYAAMALGSAGSVTSCQKDAFGLGAESISGAEASAVANAWYTPVCPQIIHDTVHVTKRDTVEVPGPKEYVTDTIRIPEIKEVHDTTYIPQIDTVYVPKVVRDTVYNDRVDTVYIPKVDTVYVPKIVHDTVTVEIPKYIVERDTIIKTVIQPINVKDAPWNVIDSLIAQGQNIGVPLEGPTPGSVGNNHVLFLGSRAYNEYDYKLYETQLDSIGTNGDGNGNGTLSLVTKITDNYKNEVSYMKTDVVIVPGRGLKLTRYVMSEAQASGSKKNSGTGLPASDNWNWTYAGYEIRTNNRDGRTNTVTTFDKYGRQLGGKEYIRGQQMGDFLYGTYIYDENGNPYTDDNGQPEKAYYDFSKAKMWSTEVKKVDGTGNFTWG